MKKLKLTFLISLFAMGFANGQVDTTDWFPMQTGNYWEYMAWTIMGPKYFSVKVVDDTLMPNGKTYKIFSEEYFDPYSQDYKYLRKDTNAIYYYVSISTYFPEGEYKYLDFIVPDSTIWLVIPVYNCCNPNARGIASTFYDNTYFSFLQKSNEAKQFEDVYVDSADTIWTPDDGSHPIVLNRGLGIVWHFRFNDGSYYLQGTIINGVKRGVITEVQNEIENVTNSFALSQNYPNPFNPSTNIQYAISSRQFVTLKVFDILGKEVATLVNEEKSAGSYDVDFNASHIASGIYYYQLRAGDFVESKKMILMK